jgi:hypothetical protein
MISSGFTKPGGCSRMKNREAHYDVVTKYRSAESSVDRIHFVGSRVTVEISKYYTTCHIYSPPRRTHCSNCDLCVRLDHQCPWIGKRIHRRFLTYLMLHGLFVACFMVYTTTITTLALFAPTVQETKADRFLSTHSHFYSWGTGTCPHLTYIVGDALGSRRIRHMHPLRQRMYAQSSAQSTASPLTPVEVLGASLHLHSPPHVYVQPKCD